MKKAWVLSYSMSASEDSDQTGRMSRLIWVFVGRTVILLVLSRGGPYLLFLDECQVYLIECIENANFSTRDKICSVSTEKQVNFLFILYFRRMTLFRYGLTFLFRINFVWFVVLSVCNIGCRPNLHLENDAGCHFNEWLTKGSRFQPPSAWRPA